MFFFPFFFSLKYPTRFCGLYCHVKRKMKAIKPLRRKERQNRSVYCCCGNRVKMKLGSTCVILKTIYTLLLVWLRFSEFDDVIFTAK